MTRTITAMFDSKADAEAAKQRLQAANIGADHIQIHDRSSEGFSHDRYSDHQDMGIWAKIKNAFLPDEDRHTYEEGVRRGGYLVTADVDESQADTAVSTLEAANGVDIDQRASEWRAQGWRGTDADSQTTGQSGPGLRERMQAAQGLGSDASREPMGAGAPEGQAYRPDWSASERRAEGMDRDLDVDGDRTAREGEQVIPLAEERLVVGKREVGRGGVRVRSYVTEQPVHEQVRLRQERVNVERRRVDQPLTDTAGDAFRERTVEMTETNEEAVVGKQARVVEEVVVSKEAGERTEEIDDKVRRTEVEVEDLGDTGRDRSPMAGETLGEADRTAFERSDRDERR